MSRTTYTVPVPENKFSQAARERIGDSIYLLGYLIQRANWEKGRALVRRDDVTRETGFPQRTISRWLQMLEAAGEVRVLRTRSGNVVEILDYASIARTRGVDYTPPAQAPRSDVPNVARDSADDVPDPAGDHATNGTADMPDMAGDDANSGTCNIRRNPSQNEVQNSFENISSLLSLGGGKGRRPPDGLFDYTPDHDRRAARARELLSQLTEEQQRVALIRAMEEMENDSRPFIRRFVARNEAGELVPRGKEGPVMVLVRAGEIVGEFSSAAILLR